MGSPSFRRGQRRSRFGRPSSLILVHGFPGASWSPPPKVLHLTQPSVVASWRGGVVTVNPSVFCEMAQNLGFDEVTDTIVVSGVEKGLGGAWWYRYLYTTVAAFR